MEGIRGYIPMGVPYTYPTNINIHTLYTPPSPYLPRVPVRLGVFLPYYLLVRELHGNHGPGTGRGL